MKRYRNLQGNSGVIAYDDGPEDGIVIEFRNDDKYLYTHASAGPDAIAEMKRLARQGHGLATFINREVRDRYARKF